MDRGNPYRHLPAAAFWKTGVAECGATGVQQIWTPRHRYDRLPIVTAGSCFAQHIGRALEAAGFDWSVAEAGPDMWEGEPDLLRKYNYGVFSFRTGNIYTAKALLQWIGMALGRLPIDDELWERGGRYFDPLRPVIEPEGFASAREAVESRRVTLDAIKATVGAGCIFVFTLGLTEAWENEATGLQYAICPGTAAGTFDPDRHRFVNDDYAATRKHLATAIKMILRANASNKVLLTVSPVPLTASASGQHVLVANARSKALLRTLAGEMRERFEAVDYFPAYELVTSAGATWFEENLRSVKPEGVAFVMRHFLDAHARSFGTLRQAGAPIQTEDEVCEDILLEAFAN